MMKKPKTIEGTCEKCGKWLKVYPYHHVIENPEHLLGTTGVPKYELVVKKYCFDCWSYINKPKYRRNSLRTHI